MDSNVPHYKALYWTYGTPLLEKRYSLGVLKANALGPPPALRGSVEWRPLPDMRGTSPDTEASS